jgi:hypothetical protein
MPRMRGGRVVTAKGRLTIHWSRRGGRPPYRGQSDALAAPRLSSGVIRLYAHWPDQVKVTPIG